MACKNEFDAAINAHEQSFNLALQLLEQAPEKGLVTDAQFSVRVLELVKLFKWTNQHAEAQAFLSTLQLQQHPMQVRRKMLVASIRWAIFTQCLNAFLLF